MLISALKNRGSSHNLPMTGSKTKPNTSDCTELCNKKRSEIKKTQRAPLLSCAKGVSTQGVWSGEDVGNPAGRGSRVTQLWLLSQFFPADSRILLKGSQLLTPTSGRVSEWIFWGRHNVPVT